MRNYTFFQKPPVVFCSVPVVAQMVKNLTEMQETQVRFLGQEDPLEKGLATHSSILAGELHGQRSLAGYSLAIRSGYMDDSPPGSSVHGVAKNQTQLSE